MTYREMFEAELSAHQLRWCQGEDCHEPRSHCRGFVMRDDKTTVHYESKIATRATLHGGLHEIGHCVNEERGLRRFQQEANAEAFATRRMRELGIPVPQRVILLGKRYVARKQRHGDRIRKSRSMGTENSRTTEGGSR